MLSMSSFRLFDHNSFLDGVITEELDVVEDVQETRKLKKRRRSCFPRKLDIQSTVTGILQYSSNVNDDEFNTQEIYAEVDNTRLSGSPIIELSPTPSFIPIKSPDEEVYISSSINLESSLTKDLKNVCSKEEEVDIIPLETVVIRPVPIRTITPNKKITGVSSSSNSTSKWSILGSHQLSSINYASDDVFRTLHSMLLTKLEDNNNMFSNGICGCEVLLAAMVEGCEQLDCSSSASINMDDAINWMFPMCSALAEWSRGKESPSKLQEETYLSPIEPVRVKKTVRFNSVCGASVSPPDDRHPFLAHAVDEAARRMVQLLVAVEDAVASRTTFSLGGGRKSYRATIARGLLRLKEASSYKYISGVCLDMSELGRHASEFRYLARLFNGEFECVLALTADVGDGEEDALSLEMELEKEEEVAGQMRRAILSSAPISLRERLSWFIGSAIRCRLRWLLDEAPPTITTETMSSRTAVALAHLNLLPPESAESSSAMSADLPLRSGVVHMVASAWAHVASGSKASETKEGKMLRDFHEGLTACAVSLLFARAARQVREVLLAVRQWRGGELAGDVGTLSSSAEFVQSWAADGLAMSCLQSRLQIAMLAVAGEAAQQFLASLLTSQLLQAEGAVGGVWATFNEFGQWIRRFGSDDVLHWELFADISAFTRLVADRAWLTPDTSAACWDTIQAVMSTQSKKRVLARASCGCGSSVCSGNVTITALRETVLHSGLVLSFPGIAVERLT